jgi:hypothetical protein
LWHWWLKSRGIVVVALMEIINVIVVVIAMAITVVALFASRCAADGNYCAYH